MPLAILPELVGVGWGPSESWGMASGVYKVNEDVFVAPGLSLWLPCKTASCHSPQATKSQKPPKEGCGTSWGDCPTLKVSQDVVGCLLLYQHPTACGVGLDAQKLGRAGS